MFGFNKKKSDEKKKKSKLDKLIMGAIVGGAVGSVIGMSIAPQKGKETRDMIAKTGKDLIKKGQDTIHKYSDPGKRIDPLAPPDDELHDEEALQKSTLLSRIKNALFGRAQKIKKRIKKNLIKNKDIQKIPNEVE